MATLMRPDHAMSIPSLWGDMQAYIPQLDGLLLRLGPAFYRRYPGRVAGFLHLGMDEAGRTSRPLLLTALAVALAQPPNARPASWPAPPQVVALDRPWLHDARDYAAVWLATALLPDRCRQTLDAVFAASMRHQLVNSVLASSYLSGVQCRRLRAWVCSPS